MEYTLYGKLYSTDITELDLSYKNLSYIDSNIKYFINLRKLYLNNNNIKEISKKIQYLTKLNRLSFSNNKIEKIPKEIGNLIELQKLNLSFNKIGEIPKEIQYLTSLLEFNLSFNKIGKISKEIGYLTQLQKLDLSNNQIREIPKEIQYLTQLQILGLSDNKITEIPTEIQYLTKLKKLGFSGNNIKALPKEIQYLTQIEEFKVTYNEIKELPLEITNLRNLNKFIYYANPLENLLNPIINRFIQRIQNKGDIHNLYTDNQNVHSSSIQQSIKDSIYNLIKEIKDDSKINYLDDSILSVQTKEALVDYSKDNQIHTQLDCTFEEVLQAVLLEINNLSDELQIEVKNRLNEEMEDGLCKCFTGRLSRLVNSLSGYSDKVSIKISSAEEIGNVISIMKDRYDDIEEVKMNVEKELLERGYEKEVIDEWLNYL